jgi:peroxiredoxin Q/BCP
MRRRAAVFGGVLAASVGISLVAPVSAAELSVGDKAPDFALSASDGKTYRLSDFKGKKAVVLAWFPKAFTGGCTTECRSLTANGEKIRAYDVAAIDKAVKPATSAEDMIAKLDELKVKKTH